MVKDQAEEALRSSLNAQRSMGRKGEHWDNYATARNVLHEELGMYGSPTSSYQLNEQTRDVLLAHGRQDSAHALCNTKSILDSNLKLSSQLRLLNFTGLIAIGLLAAIVLKLYPHLLPS